MNPNKPLCRQAPKTPTAVVCVVLSDDWPTLCASPGHVLVTTNPAWPTDQLSLPGGKVEARDHDHQDPARAAAARELHEETGVTTTPNQLVPVWEGWSGPSGRLFFVRAFRVLPSIETPVLVPETGCHLSWVDEGTLHETCPYRDANVAAMRAARGLPT